MKKPTFPILSKIALVLSGILLCVYLLIKALEKRNIYIYFLGIGAKELVPFLTIPCVALLIGAVSFFLIKNCKRMIEKFLVVIPSLLVSVVVIWFMLFGYAFSAENKYFEYTSDDGQHTIVVSEQSFLFDGHGYIYEKTSFCTMEKVGTYSTDDGYRPFTNDTFFFVWNEENFELHYYFGNGLVEFKVEEMEYVK